MTWFITLKYLVKTFDFRNSVNDTILARSSKERIVNKDGSLNVRYMHVTHRKRRLFLDIFTTMIESDWYYILTLFASSFILSWLFFAAIWYIILVVHGDLDEINIDNEDWNPCVTNMKTFSSVFLFSVETQHTIGYGTRASNDHCYEGVITQCIQSIVGVLIQATMAGVIFAKIARPEKRKETLIFSKKAVIHKRDGKLCLMMRVGDMRKSVLIESHVRAQMIRRKVTKEGEVIHYSQEELSVGVEGGDDRLFFIWPQLIIHVIDKDSPLYHLAASDLLNEAFEIVVFLEGVTESTGSNAQARTSYLPNEIVWGHRFERLVQFNWHDEIYVCDHRKFHETVETNTKLLSAAETDSTFNKIEKKFSTAVQPYLTVH